MIDICLSVSSGPGWRWKAQGTESQLARREERIKMPFGEVLWARPINGTTLLSLTFHQRELSQMLHLNARETEKCKVTRKQYSSFYRWKAVK